MVKEQIYLTGILHWIGADLKHLRFEESDNEIIVSLVDASGHDIIRGSGQDAIEALNNLHSNLL